MELDIIRTETIFIDIEAIMETKIDNNCTLEEAIDDYVSGLEDYYYYLIGEEEKEQIKNYILEIRKWGK